MSCPLSPLLSYRSLLGDPYEGVHRFRFLDTAAVDYVATLVAAILTSYSTDIPLVLSTIGWFVGSIVLHMLFGVDTESTRYLGLTCYEEILT
jgi:hypothetical protein